MPKLRIKIELNPGGEGVRLDKLSKLSGEIEKFLRSIANDSGADVKPGDLIAKNFYNSSVGAEIEYEENINTSTVIAFNNNVRYFANLNKENAEEARKFSQETLNNFIEIGKNLDPDERYRLGIININADKNKREDEEWVIFERSLSLLLDEVLKEEYEWYGTVQGTLGTWYCQSNYFNLKAFTGDTIKCKYEEPKYEEIYKAFKEKDAIVHVNGDIRTYKATGRIKEMTVSCIDEYIGLSDDEFNQIISGVIPFSNSSETASLIDIKRQG